MTIVGVVVVVVGCGGVVVIIVVVVVAVVVVECPSGGCDCCCGCANPLVHCSPGPQDWCPATTTVTARSPL